MIDSLFLITTAHLAGWTIIMSGGFILFGIYIVRFYRGIGVWSLAAFGILWGVFFILNSTIVLFLDSVGITSGAEILALSVSRNLELFFVVSTPISALLTVTAIFGWVWFVLEYTRRLDRTDKMTLLFVMFAVFLMATLNGVVGVSNSLGYVNLAPRLRSDFHQFAALVEILGTGLGIGVGVALLYGASRRHPLFNLGAVVSLTVPVIIPYLIRYVYQFGLIVDFWTIELLRSAGLTIGLCGLVLAVLRYRVFDQLPASRTVGRETAFETTDTPIIVLESEYRVADLNAAAALTFDVSMNEVIGETLGAVLPEAVDATRLQDSGETTFHVPNGNRILEAQTTTMSDDRGREIGHTIVFKDLTEERNRQQRIQVLNRVLRHNLRNGLALGLGYVDLIESSNGSSRHTRRLRTSLDDLVDIGQKAREVEELLDAEPTVERPTPLREVVDDAIFGVQGDEECISVDVDVPDDLHVFTNPDILRAVLKELIENAVQHTESGNVEITFVGESNAILVRDHGPGIPDHELEVLESERETPLQHASGLGLWLAKWGTGRVGGELRFASQTDGGRINVALPGEQIVHLQSDAIS